MHNIASLVNIVFYEINDTIDLYRESKRNQFYYEPYPTATQDEILDFVSSCPYFGNDLKKFLLGQAESSEIDVSDKWIIEYKKIVEEWAMSFEWLHGDSKFQSFPLLTDSEKIRIIDLP